VPHAPRRNRLALTSKIVWRRLARSAQMRHLLPRHRHTAAALAAGTLGGALFSALNLPAAWLSGSMIAVAALSLARVRLTVPWPLCAIAFVLLGISMGGRFNAGMLAEIAKWPLSLLALALSVPAIIFAVTAYLNRVTAWNRSTTFFAGIPGAISYVTALTLESKADARMVMLVQMLRLMILMAVLPPLIAASQTQMPSASPAAHAGWLQGWSALALLLGAGTAAAYTAQRLRVPAGLMLGAMTASAALHLAGIAGSSAQLPPLVTAISSIVLGGFIGARFQGTDLSVIRPALMPSLGAFLISLTVAGLFAVAVSWTLALPFGLVMVAFAPGGLEAMMILSFLLGLDPAYVGTHQIARFAGIALLLPLFARGHLTKRQ
jgi:membrane AbrB-like protein